MSKIVMIILVLFIILALLFVGVFFIAKAPVQGKISWGVDFSQMQAESLGLDWKETYLAILEDLGVRSIKLHTQWDWVEGKKNDFYFKDIDWQIKEAQKHNASIIYVVGLKTGRWPECHAPDWLADLSPKDQQQELLAYVQTVVMRYKNSPSIIAWQVENEPLFKFGQCPAWYYDGTDFLQQEVSLVKSQDPTRPVIISDSGEQSLWFKAAKIGDIVGSTLYRKLWFGANNALGFYGSFPIPPIAYYYRSEAIAYFFGKDVMGIELQAEPWGRGSLYDLSLQEQEKTMDINQFKENIAYARQTGFKEFYFWGTEWWYWLKEKQHKPEIWNYAKELFVK
jgi:hypothetical protein